MVGRAALFGSLPIRRDGISRVACVVRVLRPPRTPVAPRVPSSPAYQGCGAGCPRDRISLLAAGREVHQYGHAREPARNWTRRTLWLTSRFPAPRWVGGDGPQVVDPSGVISGMAAAAVTRASRGYRPKLLESVSRERMARLLSGLNPVPPVDKSASESRRSNVKPVVNLEQYVRTHREAPAQPHEEPRVWGVNSFAQVPERGGEISPGAAQQLGYRTPCLKGSDTALDFGMWVAVVDRTVLRQCPWRPRRAKWRTRVRTACKRVRTTKGPRVYGVSLALRSVFAGPRPRGRHSVRGHAVRRASCAGIRVGT